MFSTMLIRMLALSFFISAFVLPNESQGSTLNGDLRVVAASKLPNQAHHPGQAMELSLVSPDTLYLYIEQDNGKNVAVFDVTEPSKIRLKKLAEVNAPAPFDFVQPAGQHTELIRYRDGSGSALLDLSNPKHPRLKSTTQPANESYVIPVETGAYGINKIDQTPHSIAGDYQVTSGSRPIVVVKEVIQQVMDEANGTIYLLNPDGLTVIRNLRSEARLAATAPIWRNSFDDN